MPIHDWTTVDAGIFHDFHHGWITTLNRSLNGGRLPNGYYALAEQTVGGLGPSWRTLESSENENGPTQRSSNQSEEGGIAIATAPPRVWMTAERHMGHYAKKRNRVTIRHASGDHVVAVIELVSPGNKSSRHSIDAFVRKAAELIDAGVHLLVVDLFPPTRRDPEGIHGAIWSHIEADGFKLPADRPFTTVSYKAGEIAQAWIEPVAVGMTLPDMPIFLTPQRYIPFPLESTYREAWSGVPARWRDRIEHGGK